MMARLTEEVGELARAMNLKYGGKRKKFDGDGREIKDELSDVLYTVLAIGNNEGVDLNQSLIDKIKKSHKKLKEVYLDDNTNIK